jgi:TonB family protein
MAYINVPKMPQFASGKEGWEKYLAQNLQYPPKAITSKTEGTVLIECRVDVFGKLSHFKILEDPGNGLGEEALRLLKESPDWLPAQQGGKWVHTRIKVPVSFTLK